MKVSLYAILILLCFSTLIMAVPSERVAFGHSVEVAKDEVVDKAVAFGGDIYVKGRVIREVVAFGGSVHISGTVDGKVVAFGGKIILEPTALVKGKITCIGGSVQKDSNAKVEGELVNLPFLSLFGFVKPMFHFASKWSIPVLIMFGLIRLIIMLALSVLIAVLFEKPVNLLRAGLESKFIKSSLFGFLIVIVCPIAFVVLLVTVIGIFFIPLLILLLLAGVIFGKVGISALIGQRLQQAISKKKKETSIILDVIYGEILLGLVCLIPIVGILVRIIIVLISLGIVLMTRFGTRKV